MGNLKGFIWLASLYGPADPVMIPNYAGNELDRSYVLVRMYLLELEETNHFMHSRTLCQLSYFIILCYGLEYMRMRMRIWVCVRMCMCVCFSS